VVVLEGVVRLLRALAAEPGLLVVLEDVHWGDRDTLAAVEYAADALAASRVCFLCTERSHMAGPAADMTARLTARRAAQSIQLQRLGEADVARLARLTLDAPVLPASLLDVLRHGPRASPS
jgi:predicted ATPase